MNSEFKKSENQIEEVSQKKVLYLLIKRFLDIVLVLLMFLYALPVMILIALIIKIDSRGPVFYIQTRVGKNGHLFSLIQFRTMFFREDSQFIWSLDIPLITRVGRFLRKTGLDELPWLFNILKGDMSFVGPRPVQPFEVKHYQNWQRERLKCKPGITGPWQLHLVSTKDFNEMIKMDIEYIRNQSILLDFKILLRTIVASIRGERVF